MSTPDKNTLLALLADARLAALGERYDAPVADRPGLATRLQKYRHLLGANRFVLPIAGIQGCGKSTLLNALAFDEPVLPIDADETTCVPVEIRWAASPTPSAIVHYGDGRTETLPRTEDALRSVVHNENNPGNEKGVVRVVLESSCEMFRQGLVLVDLPGVGSLTAANAATTQRYLDEAVGVIFMIRTVPPLTRSEAIFVGLHWAALRTAIFVQNRWYDETDDEALAGCEHNAKVLQGIAEQAKIGLKAPPMIRIVNGYEALRAALTRDEGLEALSGLAALRGELERLGADWGGRVEHDVRVALAAELDGLADVIARRLEDATQDRRAHEERIRNEAGRFAESMQDLDARAARMRDDADTFRHAVRKRLQAWANDKGAELRNRMRSKMRSGIVDGPRLARALADEQSVMTDDIFVEVQEDALALQDRLRMELEGLDAWGAAAPDLRFTVNAEEMTKWENVAGSAGSVAGGAGGAWAGAEAGAFIGALGGPPGVLIGGVIGGLVGGLLGGLGGAWLGRKTKDHVNERRVAAVEGDVNTAVDNYIREMTKALNGVADAFCRRLGEVLEGWRVSKREGFEAEQQASAAVMNASADEKVRLADEFAAHLADVKFLRNRIGEVMA